MSKLKREDIKNKRTSVEAGPWRKACTTYYEDREKYRAFKTKLNDFKKTNKITKAVVAKVDEMLKELKTLKTKMLESRHKMNGSALRTFTEQKWTQKFHPTAKVTLNKEQTNMLLINLMLAYIKFDKLPANAKLVLELDQSQLNMKIQGSENADKN